MPVRILHVSDLHVGAHDEARKEIERSVGDLVATEPPELVIASGDLTHRNRRDQHERAATFLRSLAVPILAIPGNHDLPPLPPGRFTASFGRFLDVWPETEPVYRSEDAIVCGLNSVRPWKYQRGAIDRKQLERLREAFSDVADTALRAVAVHHHLAGAPWRTGKRSIPHRSSVLAALTAAGADIVVGGHTHQSVVVARREFMQPLPGARQVVLSTAPGLGRPRPGRHAEAAGVHTYEADETSLRVTTRIWDGARLVPVSERRFPRTRR